LIIREAYRDELDALRAIELAAGRAFAGSACPRSREV
jgi:hypothetical protein